MEDLSLPTVQFTQEKDDITLFRELVDYQKLLECSFNVNRRATLDNIWADRAACDWIWILLDSRRCASVV